MDLKLTDGGDMDITNGELSFVTGLDAIAQDLRMAWQTWLGESVYDTSAGVPYLQVFFKDTNPNLDAIRFTLQTIGEQRPGVISVLLTPVLDPATRILSLADGTAQTIEGELDLTKVFTPVTP